MALGAIVDMRSGQPYDVRIDRRSRWGNPFRMASEAERDACVLAFEGWVRTSTEPRAVWIRDHVHELAGKVLGCWCAPRRCHGDVLAAMALEASG